MFLQFSVSCSNNAFLSPLNYELRSLSAQKYGRQKEKGTTEDEMVGWHHRLNGHGSEETRGDIGGQTWRAAVHGVAKSWTWTEHLALNTKSFPGNSGGKESACNVGDPGLIPGSGRSPGEGNGYQLGYSCLENSMDGRSWWPTVHRVAKNQTWLSEFHLVTEQQQQNKDLSQVRGMTVKKMKIVKRFLSMGLGLRKVCGLPTDAGTYLLVFVVCENNHKYGDFWRRQWHPTPVLLPGKSHGWRSLVGCSPWGC